ncbi:MarR family winged helix-turn-helix transcriptional regulator [Nakamurella deserti]|uniref:MarR family winged helix-turn-helix transcriptional regulator n=1 Tax=Nakamurella deserti TaxID=2164074 RepID=UPI000DBE084A|nr:MarR family transcriptional regulator [Nakamurella deserti]
MPDVAPLAADLRFALNRLNRRLRHQQLGDDLTVSQLSALAVLRREGPLSAGDLAAREHVRPPSMTRIIAALQRLGMIERKVNPDDGRQVMIGVTPAGARRADAEGAARERWLAQKLSAMTPEERALLRQAAALLNQLAER